MKSLLTVCFSFIIFISFCQEEWEHIYGNDDGLSISNTFIVDSSHIWGQSDHWIFFSNDFGENWEPQFYYGESGFNGAFFADSLTGWFCGFDEVVHTLDGGETWEYQTLPDFPYLSLYSVFFLNKDTGWVAGSSASVFQTYDGGTNWLLIHGSLSMPFNIYEIHFSDPFHGCAAGWGVYAFNPYVITTFDGGNNWSLWTEPSDYGLVDVQITSESEAWACSMNGHLFRSLDGGLNWEDYLSFPCGFNNDCMHFFNVNDAIIACPINIYMIMTQNSWLDYQVNNINGINRFNDFSFDKEGFGIASGWGNLLKTLDEGHTWNRINDRFVKLAFFDEDIGCIIEETPNKALLRTTDGGFTWNEFEAGHAGTPLEMSFVNNSTGFIVTDKPELLRTNNAGASWDLISLPLDSTWFSDMQFLNADTGYLCAKQARIFKTTDGGQEWETFYLDLNWIFAIDFISPMEGWALDRYGNVAHTSDGGENWSYSVTPPTNGSAWDIDFVDPLIGYVISYSGYLFKTLDGGKNWGELHFMAEKSTGIHFFDELNGWIVGEDFIYRTYNGGYDWSVVLENSSSNFHPEFTDLYVIDTSNAWICSMDGRVFSCSDFLDIEENQLQTTVKYFPNPAHDMLTVQLSDLNDRMISIMIYGIDGKMIQRMHFNDSNDNTIQLDLSRYARGVYFLNIQSGSFSRRIKILKM